MSSKQKTVFNQPLVFVDIETNGLDHLRGRVIEVAAIRVEAGKIVKKFSSLVDPETEIPYYITNLTGITTNDVKKAPTFHQLAPELQEILDGAIFVAHNVRFDYSFLKQEFKRLGQPFLPKQLCTVKLSRAMYPFDRGHKLEDLIRRYNFTYGKRHRAYDDAAVLWQFMQHIHKHFPPEQVQAAVAKQLKQPTIPQQIAPELVRDLPETPGVYIFEDAAGQPLYIGKSVNIKKRVLSHFARDHAESQEFRIAQTISHIRTESTTGELTALLLESQRIKELQPMYNKKLRRLEKVTLARYRTDEDGYIRIYLEEANTITPEAAATILAVYPRAKKAKDSLMLLGRDFELCPRLLGLEKSSSKQQQACFWYQLHKCRGACAGQEAAENYNQRLLTAFENRRIQAWPFKGPVMVEETNSQGASHGIIVDKWCVLGELIQEPHCDPVLKPAAKTFDMDTYKILQSQINHRLKQLIIRPVDYQQLSQLGI